MSGRYVLTPLAQVDIDRIWTETAKKWGIDQAETYIREISEHIKLVAERPSIGRACPEIRAGYYKYPAASYGLFYRRAKEVIEVVRILHERMDFNHHL